jgi:hypothetical protein
MTTWMPTVGWFEGSGDQLAALFALADDSPTAVSAYRDLGRVLSARRPSADRSVAQCCSPQPRRPIRACCASISSLVPAASRRARRLHARGRLSRHRRRRRSAPRPGLALADNRQRSGVQPRSAGTLRLPRPTSDARPTVRVVDRANPAAVRRLSDPSPRSTPRLRALMTAGSSSPSCATTTGELSAGPVRPAPPPPPALTRTERVSIAPAVGIVHSGNLAEDHAAHPLCRERRGARRHGRSAADGQ